MLTKKQKNFRLSNKTAKEFDYIRAYYNRTFDDTLSLIVESTMLKIQKELAEVSKEEVKETSENLSFQFQQLALKFVELQKNISKSFEEIGNLSTKVHSYNLGRVDNIGNLQKDLERYKEKVRVLEVDMERLRNSKLTGIAFK